MAKYRVVHTQFWKSPVYMEEMNPEDRYFYLYLITNPQTTQCGIYRMTIRQMAFELGYQMENVQSLMDRFIGKYKLIRYNSKTWELAIKNWGKDNLVKGGKPIMDCILSELKEVEDRSLIGYVLEGIPRQDIRSLYESFCKQEEVVLENKIDQSENELNLTECEELDDPLPRRQTIRGQKENQKQKEKQQQKAFSPSIENNPYIENTIQRQQKTEDVKEVIEFWDTNGFGFSNVNAKQQLLSWLDDSSFLQPKEIILKAMKIACVNNKRKLNYVVGILKNWESESLFTIEDIDSNDENKQKQRLLNKSYPVGRAVPGGFTLDLTAGEE